MIYVMEKKLERVFMQNNSALTIMDMDGYLRRSCKLALISEEKLSSRIFPCVSSQKMLRHGGLE